MRIPKPPEWLNEWEAETEEAILHPEYRVDPVQRQCAQCFHGVHYMRCNVIMSSGPTPNCDCPGLSRPGPGDVGLTM